MPTPKVNEEKITNAVSAWENLAKTASFAKLTLAQFKTKVQPSLDARATIKELQDQLNAAQAEREIADRDSLAVTQQIINGVKADDDFGDNSALYEALGYVRKDERKSGLKRGTNKKVTTPA